MSVLLIAGAAVFLPVAAVTADDDRLESTRTFISPAAEVQLAGDDGTVYCLDRPRSARYRTICLTSDEWQKAIALADAASEKGPRAIVPMKYRPTNERFGLSGFRSR